MYTYEYVHRHAGAHTCPTQEISSEFRAPSLPLKFVKSLPLLLLMLLPNIFSHTDYHLLSSFRIEETCNADSGFLHGSSFGFEENLSKCRLQQPLTFFFHNAIREQTR